MSNLWSKEDISFLVNNYMTLSYKKLGTILSRSENSIEKKIKRLGLVKKDSSVFEYWDSDKLTFLINNYNNYSYDDLSDKIGFNKRKIIKKLSELKLKKNREKKLSSYIPIIKNRGELYCKICNHGLKDLKGLEIHLVKIHKDINIESYFLLNKVGNIKKCRICNKDGRFLSLKNGYRDLCNNKICIIKSQETGTIDFWINKGFSKEDAKIRFKEYTNKRVSSLLNGDRLRLEENPNYYKEKSHNSKEYWLKRGFNIEDSILNSNNVMKIIAKKTSIIKKANPEKYISTNNTKIEYYLKKGFTQEDATLLLSERQKTFTMEKLINKHGEKNAEIIYKKRQEKWIKSLHNNGNLKNGYSMVSQKLFNTIDEYYENNNFQYMLKNEEFTISRYAIDFIDHSSNKIIEFNGDLYHANPHIFIETDKPNPWNKDLLASQIWDRDSKRNSLIESLGYQVLVIWESEYKKYPQQTLEKCIEFINKKISTTNT